MGVHEQSVGATDEWYTPPYIFEALGCTFDLDVASPRKRAPWIPAKKHFYDRALEKEWEGFVWMNPPFGGRNGLVPWLRKFVEHGNGICLVPDRTSAPWWQEWALEMDRILFVSPKIKFIREDGELGKSPAQGTCLGGMGMSALRPLYRAFEKGLGILGDFRV